MTIVTGKAEGMKNRRKDTWVIVGAVETVESVLDVMLRQLHAEVRRAGPALYCGRHVGGGAEVALASTMRRSRTTLVASGPTIVTGEPA